MGSYVPMITTSQLALVHTLAKQARMDDDLYRDFLHRETGHRSARDLTAALAAHVIDKLKDAAGQAGVRGAVAGLDSPVAGKMRALWIAGYNLGLVRDRSDHAMLAFLERQARVSHTRFLTHPGEASSAIEALKSWLARDGKVKWPPREAWNKDGKADEPEILAAKRAVLDAQWLRLIEIGTVQPINPQDVLSGLDGYAFKVAAKNGWCFFESRDYDHVQQALGRKLRAALAERSRRQGGA